MDDRDNISSMYADRGVCQLSLAMRGHFHLAEGDTRCSYLIPTYAQPTSSAGLNAQVLHVGPVDILGLLSRMAGSIVVCHEVQDTS